MKYYIELDDKRNKYVYHNLQKLNLCVEEYNLNTSITDTQSVLIFSPAKKLVINQIENLPNNVTIFGGNQASDVVNLINQKNITYHNCLLDKVFVVKNAMLTAEGVLSLIIEKTEKSVFDNNILVIGTGAVGKAIMQLLYKLNLKFGIVTFNPIKVAENQYYMRPIYLQNQVLPHINEYDIIINTAPTKFFEDEFLTSINKQTLILEVASVDCLNRVLANELNLNFVPAQALPQKFSCISAGELVFEFILKYSKEEF